MDNLMQLLKDRPLYIPRVLLRNYKQLNIEDEELIIIILILSYGNKVIYDPEEFSKELNDNKKNIMRIIDRLCDKNIFSLIIEKKDKKTYEYISVDSLYEKLLNIIIDEEKPVEITDNSIFTTFENELGRMLSPMEYEKIKEWITSGNTQEIIICALREAVLNGVNNLNYIDSILNNWKKKGYKTKKDISKEKYKTTKDKVEVFNMDWLNE